MTPSKTEAFLGVHPGDVVAFVGGGGKTTLLTALALRLAKEGRKVIVAATRPFRLPPGSLPFTFLADERPFGELLPNLGEHGAVAAAPDRLADGRLAGYRPEEVDTFADVGDYLFVEAEDAGGESLPPADAPRAIPPLATVIGVVAGLDALGPDLDAAAFATRIAGPEGILSRLPEGPRKVLFLHKADRHSVRLDGARVSREVRRLAGGGSDLRILLTSVRDFLRRRE